VRPSDPLRRYEVGGESRSYQNRCINTTPYAEKTRQIGSSLAIFLPLPNSSPQTPNRHGHGAAAKDNRVGEPPHSDRKGFRGYYRLMMIKQKIKLTFDDCTAQAEKIWRREINARQIKFREETHFLTFPMKRGLV
jgi:hypothetical protein